MSVNYRKVAGYHIDEEYRGLSIEEAEWLTKFDQDYYARIGPRDLMGLIAARVDGQGPTITDSSVGHCSEIVAWWVSQKARRKTSRQSHSYTGADYRWWGDSPEDKLIAWIDKAVSV